MLAARRAVPTLAAIAAAAIPTGAQAATVQTDRECYSPGDSVTETGSGFTPNTEVVENLALVSVSSSQFWNFAAPTLTTDDQGAFSRKLRAPKLKRSADREEMATSTFTDQANTSAFVTAGWTLSDWSVQIKEWAGHVAKPGRSMTIDTYGWTTAAGTLYAHYYRGKTHLKSVRIGAATGACGNLKQKIAQFPFKKVKAGQYSLFISRTPSLDKANDAWLRMNVRVPKSAATA